MTASVKMSNWPEVRLMLQFGSWLGLGSVLNSG